MNYLVEKSSLSDSKSQALANSRIEFKLLDCRKVKKGVALPCSIELPESAFKSNEVLKEFLVDLCKKEENTHICLLITDNFNKEEQKFVASALRVFRALNKNYMSIVLGGYQVYRIIEYLVMR